MVLLMGPGTFSEEEDFASAFDILKVGTIIGEPAGGTTGQSLEIAMPGGDGLGELCGGA